MKMIKTLNLQDIKQKVIALMDRRVRIITAGLGLDELRALLRGDHQPTHPLDHRRGVPA